MATIAVSAERPKDSLPRERVENRFELTLADRGVAGQIFDPVSDLRA